MVEKHLASLERLGQEDRASVIAAVVAQLRHAYYNLIGPEAAWDRDQRMRFANKLIAPLVKLEAALAVPPVPTAGWQEMSTAPDGTMILICDMTSTEARDWCFVDWLVRGLLIAHPLRHATHWMPLPSPPQEPTD
jgi:hypothetical protein